MKLIVFFFIIFLINENNTSELNLIPDELITNIKISKLENTLIKEKSIIFTNNTLFPNFKFFKIDFSSILDISDKNIFSFIKI